MATRFCIKCGKRFPYDAKFCCHCGAAVPSTESAQIGKQPAPPSTEYAFAGKQLPSAEYVNTGASSGSAQTGKQPAKLSSTEYSITGKELKEQQAAGASVGKLQQAPGASVGKQQQAGSVSVGKQQAAGKQAAGAPTGNTGVSYASSGTSPSPSQQGWQYDQFDGKSHGRPAKNGALPKSIQRPQVSLLSLRQSRPACYRRQEVDVLKKSWDCEVTQGVSPDKLTKALELYVRKLNARLTTGAYSADLQEQLRNHVLPVTTHGGNVCARIRTTNGTSIIMAKMTKTGNIDMGLLVSEQVSEHDDSQALVEWEIATQAFANMELSNR